MTDETRETLTKLARELEQVAATCKRLGAESPNRIYEALTVQRQKEAAALRDVLTPRTCGSCRHSVEHRRWNDGGVFLICEHLSSLARCNTVRPDDGCIRGWQAREGEGGTR